MTSKPSAVLDRPTTPGIDDPPLLARFWNGKEIVGQVPVTITARRRRFADGTVTFAPDNLPVTVTRATLITPRQEFEIPIRTYHLEYPGDNLTLTLLNIDLG